ncbi:glycosyltransferase [bacterium]|nr:glycosyltransferase [bacterium]
MKPRSIAMVCSSRIWAGTEKWVLHTAEGLIDRGYNVHLFVRRTDLWSNRMQSPVPLKRLPFLNDWDLFTFFALLTEFPNYDLVLPARVRDYWLAGTAAKTAGRPVLLRLGVVRRLRDRHWRDRARYGRIPNRIVVNADAIRDTLRETPWMRRMPIDVVRNGVDLIESVSEAEKLALRRQLSIPTDAFLVLGAGRLGTEKRWDLLLRATAKLKGEAPTLQTYILGEGKERPALEMLAADLGIQDQAFLPGHQDSIEPWLRAADLVVQPSIREGLSNVILEAMGAGLPVICTDGGGGVREVFQPDRDLWMVEPDNAERLVERMKYAIDRPAERLQIGQAARRWVEQSFSWNAMLDQLEPVLQATCGDVD